MAIGQRQQFNGAHIQRRLVLSDVTLGGGGAPVTATLPSPRRGIMRIETLAQNVFVHARRAVHRWSGAVWALALAICLLAPVNADAQFIPVPSGQWSGTLSFTHKFAWLHSGSPFGHSFDGTLTTTFTIARGGSVVVDAVLQGTGYYGCSYVGNGSFKGPISGTPTLLMAPSGEYHVDNLPPLRILTRTTYQYANGCPANFLYENVTADYTLNKWGMTAAGAPTLTGSFTGSQVYTGLESWITNATWSLQRDVCDLEVMSVSPVQAIFNAGELVAGKETTLQAKISNRYCGTSARNVDVTITHANGTAATETMSIAPGEHIYYLPGRGTLRPSGSEFYVRLDVDPANTLPEVDETNNGKAMARPLPVVDTKRFRVLFVPVVPLGESLPGCTELVQMARNSWDYLTAAYPIDDRETYFSADCFYALIHPNAPIPLVDLFGYDQRDVLKQLDRMARESGFDRAIGVVRKGWFNDFGKAPAVLGRALFPGGSGETRSALIELSDPVVVAHEIAHTWGWVSEGHPLELASKPRHLLASAEGLDLRSWTLILKSLGWTDFMNPYGATDQWISKPTWDYLLSRLRITPPAKSQTTEGSLQATTVIGISGKTSGDGSIRLDPMYRMTGAPDVPLGAPGEYRVLYQDAAGNTLAETGFSASSGSSSPVAGDDSSAGIFSLTIPEVAGTTKFLLQYQGITRAEQVVSPHAPELTLLTPREGDTYLNGASVDVTWQAFDLDGDQLHFVVSISEDAGATWVPLATDLAASQLTFVVPPRVRIKTALIRVVATDGFNTAVAISDAPFILGDVLPPVITLNGPAFITLEAFSVFADPGATAVDAAAGDLSAAIQVSGKVEPTIVGTYTLLYRVYDPSGNRGDATRTVAIVDTTPPVLTIPSSRVVEATSGAGATVIFQVAASDRVDGTVQATCTPASGATFPLGITQVSCFAVDRRGNTSNAGFTITVVDTTPPSFAMTADNEPFEPTSAAGVSIISLATAFDSVDGAVPVTCLPASGFMFPIGTTQVTCSTADARGNRASITFAVTVVYSPFDCAGVRSEIATLKRQITNLQAQLQTAPSGEKAELVEQIRALQDRLAKMEQRALQVCPVERKAQFVVQNVPGQMVAGKSYSVSVTMQNTGGGNWSSAELYRLGSQSPQDNVKWGLGRVSLPGSIPPGGQATFSFVVTAPSTPGSYSFQWQMVQDGVAWFGDMTPRIDIGVTAPPPPVQRCFDHRGKPIPCDGL